MLQTITPPMPATFFVSIEKFCKKLRTSEHCCCRSASLQVNCYILLCVFVFVKKRTSAQNTEHCRSAAVRRKTHKNRTTRTWQHCYPHNTVDISHCVQCCGLCHLHMCATLTCRYIALSPIYRSVVFRFYRKVLQKTPNGRTLALSLGIIAAQ